MTSTPRPQPATFASPEAAVAAEKPPRRGITKLAWVLWGFVGSILGGVAGGYAGVLSIADSTDDFSGLIIIFTIPMGWFIGGLVAILLAWVAEHENRSPKGNSSRAFLTAGGFLTPPFLLVLLVFGTQAVMGG